MKTQLSVALLAAALQIQAAQAQSNSSVGNFLTGGATIERVEHDGAAPIAANESVVIHDFTVHADLATIDNSLAGRLHRKREARHGKDDDSTSEVLAQHVRTVFAKALTDQLEKDHVTQVVKGAAAASEGNGPQLVIDGEFTAIDEGNKTMRKLIGFGSGASDLKTHVTVSSITAGHSTVVLAFDLDSNSGAAPGKVATMGINSQIAGTAVGALGAMGTTVDADASRMAKLVAKQIESLTGVANAAASPPATSGALAAQARRTAG